MRKESRSQRIQQGAEELKALIRARFPDAEFGMTERQWPVRGVYIEAYVDASDDLEITELISKRRAELLTDQGIYFLVITHPSSERPSVTAAIDPPSAKSA